VNVNLRGDFESCAEIDPTRMYRYSLIRTWEASLPRVCFIMLNPSTADAEQDDPTIRRCLHFARQEGFGSLEVVNLYAYRTTDRKVLASVRDPVGPGNDAAIRRAIARAEKVVLAWGASADLNRADNVRILVREAYALGLNKDGSPRHPLYVPGSQRLERDWTTIRRKHSRCICRGVRS